MAFQPPPSPPLPTFAIKDLCGPANPPGLISISKRRYDATVKSTPDATLLYLDDDDGELITVGSSFELIQRLEEPVPRYIREFRNPTDGKLVHVFDINHSTGSLLQWRDHEAYSSKCFQAPRQEASFLSLGDLNQSAAPSSPRVTYPSLPAADDKETTDHAVEDPQLPQANCIPEQRNSEKALKDNTTNILDGIEEHLSGLANVLQIAANTLQKAADKTRETDTSVVEDILVGVKGILTQVGSFGVEAFKELGAEIKPIADESVAGNSSISSVTDSTKKDSIPAQLAREAKEVYEIKYAHQEEDMPKDAALSLEDRTVGEEEHNDASPKVKFDLSANPDQRSSTSPETSSLTDILTRLNRTDPSPQSGSSKNVATIKAHNPSILDDLSEDADFTARYPPLSTVRRARSTVERSSKWHGEPKMKTRCQWYRELVAAEMGIPQRANPHMPSTKSSFVSPFSSPSSSTVDASTATKKNDSGNRIENVDTVQKPLPGAWPDIKNDSTPALPVSTESSGDFFNRMVGRGRPGRYRTPTFEPSLHRANTTASSNPASRLNGPFDPGFPYDTSPTSSHKPSPFRPYRSHRRSASPPRHWANKFHATHTKTERPSFSPSSSDSPASVPAKVSAPPHNIEQTPIINSRSKYDSHRAVKHHRSVPQFYSPPSPPSQASTSKAPIVDTFQPPSRTFTDFLSGPPMPMPPPIPFTARPPPPFMPKPFPPNIWAPWQSSPPTQDHARSDEGAGSSISSGVSAGRNTGSSVSSQSTLAKDFDLPSNEPPFPSAQPQTRTMSPPPRSRFQPPAAVAPALPVFFPPPPPLECMQVEPMVDKIDECVEQLKMCGFGIDDENLKNRLHVYAVAADGDVTEAVEMIEQDRRMTAPGRFD